MTTETYADHLAGYRVVRKLGEGTRSVVYLGVVDGEGPDEPAVALKVFRPTLGDADIMAELDVLARVPTAHCVHLLDASTGPDGTPVAVMSRAARGSIGRLLHRRGTVAPGEAVTIIAPLARAVTDLHRRGITHTRISGSSVHFADDGSPQLLGFGHAGVLAPDAPPVVLEGDARARLDRRALAQLTLLLLRSDQHEIHHLVPRSAAQDLQHWLRDDAAIASAAFPLQLEERMFDLCDAEPVSVDRQPAPARTFHAGGSTPSRVEGVLPAGAMEVTAQHAGTRSDSLVDQFLGASPLSSAWKRLLRSLRAVRLRWWIALSSTIVAAVALLTLVPGAASWSTGTVARPIVPWQGEESSAADAESAGPRWSTEPTAALPELWAERARCLALEPVLCLDSVDQLGSALHRTDSANIAARPSDASEGAAADLSPGSIELVAVLGDAAVVEFTLNEKPASVLMIRTEAGWRLRTLFGVEEP